MNTKANCSGCSACASVCPKECIKIEYNEDGFLRPFTDEKSCIHCDLCEKVCPMERTNAVSLDDGVLYAAWGDVVDQKKSSSEVWLLSLHVMQCHVDMRYVVQHLTITH